MHNPGTVETFAQLSLNFIDSVHTFTNVLLNLTDGCRDQTPSLRCRDSGPYCFPKRTLRTRSKRQPRSPDLARFARTRAPRASWWTVCYCNTTRITCSTAALELGTHNERIISENPCTQIMPLFLNYTYSLSTT